MKALVLNPKASLVGIPSQRTRPRSRAAAIPWLLLIFLWAVLFPIYNQFGSGSYALDDQEAVSELVQQTQAGDPLNRAAITILGIVGAVLLVRYRSRIRLQSLLATTLFAFLAWSGATALWAIDPGLTAKRLVSLGFIILFGAGLAVRIQRWPLLIFMAVFPIVTCIAGLAFEIVRGTFQPRAEDYRFCGTAPHPNVEASILSVGVILLTWMTFQSRGKIRLFFASSLIFLSGFLFLTRSRTSLFAVVIALAFSGVLILFRNYRMRVPIVIASLCLILSVASLLNMGVSADSAKSSLFSSFHRSDDEEGPASLSGRVDLWKSLWPYVVQRPLRGYGYSGFWTPTHIEEVSADQHWKIQQGHSGYMDLILSLGLPGAILYVALLAGCVVRSVSLFNRVDTIYGVWAAFLVFIAVHNINESINVFSSFTNLSFYVIALNLATIRPTLWNEIRSTESI